MLLQVCHTVAYAHSRSVLHRDIKPANIILGEFGEVLLLDWGIARFLADPDETLTSGRPINTASPEALTEYGSMIGTPGYMAPEQAVGAPPDVRSDVWSLGAVLYQLLTFTKTFEGPTLEAMMALMQGPPLDPRKRAPELEIGDDIAEICIAALEADLRPRTASAMALHDAIDDVLQGRARAAAAARTVEEARGVWEEHRQQRRERRTLLGREAQLEGSIPLWAPLEQKADLLWVRRRLRALEVESSDTVEHVVSLAENALNQDPTCEPAADLLAQVHYARFEEAEEAGDVPAQRWSAGRVRKYDADGSWTVRLRGMGSLTLRTNPPGAEVICERFDRDEIVARKVDRRVLGKTPLEDVPIEPGSYLLTIRSPGLRPTRYPIFLPRGHRWNSGAVPVPLYSDAQIGDGFVYIPGGPTRIGGLVGGVRDVAGSMRTWCREASYDGNEELRTVRGGFWNCSPAQYRVTSRWGDEPQQAFTLTGFRLVRDRPLPG